jgi:hypothetical protein
MGIPKKIWLLWLQGLDGAPEMIKNCYTSWVKQNSDWEIILLTEENLDKYCPLEIQPLLEADNITKQALSDIIRINLLATQGGVWADATCFCTRPLDDWLPDYSKSGFFAFASPEGSPTAISSWFLAGHPENHLVQEFKRIVNAYWFENKGIQVWNSSLISRIPFKYTGLATWLDARPGYWFHPLLLKWMKLHPYFWFHYLFTLKLPLDNDFCRAWEDVPRFSSDFPHRIQQYGMLKEANAQLKEEIDTVVSPLYKLNWRVDTVPSGSALDYLLSRTY